MKNNFLIILVLSVITFISCDDYVADVNEDPNSQTKVPGELLVGQAELELVQLYSGESNRLAGIFTDQFIGADRQYIAYNNYNLTTGDFNSIWGSIYGSGYAQAKIVKDYAEEKDNRYLKGVAEILMSAFIGESALLFGDVPFAQAADYDQYPDPIYDTQTSVLQGVQNLLSSGITNIEDIEVSDGDYGYNFGGVFVANNAKWAEIGHTLKARYYLAVENYPMALTEAKMGISSPDGDLLSSHSSSSGSQNLYYQFGRLQRSGYLTVSGSTLQKFLNGTKPRLLSTPGDAQRAAIYFSGNQLNYNSNGYFAINAPAHLVSWIETRLIEAEAAVRIGEDGLTPFNEVREYLEDIYSGSFPASTASGNDLLLQILEEKYISLIGQLSIFSDVRRTENVLGVAIKSSTKTTIPQRFLYPQSEIDTNENFPGLKDLFERTPINQ